MKIGVSSYSFYTHMRKTGESLEMVCTRAKEMGFEGIEFLRLEDPSIAAALAEHCAKIDLPIIAYTVGADFIKNGLEEEAERVRKDIDTAKELGAPLLRHDVCYGFDGGWREAVRRVAPAVREVSEYAAERGIRTCTENHGFFLQDADRVEELMLAVNHENYGWLVDIGNFACADEDSLHAVSIAAPYAFHVHAKDFLVKPRRADNPGQGWFKTRHGRYLRGTIAGHGHIPIKACVDILRGTAYDGFLSYEFEGMEDNLPALEAGLAFLRTVI